MTVSLLDTAIRTFVPSCPISPHCAIRSSSGFSTPGSSCLGFGSAMTYVVLPLQMYRLTKSVLASLVSSSSCRYSCWL